MEKEEKMSDLINRQAAIDALIEWYGCEPNDIECFKEIIEAKPSAEPNIVRCKDCKYAYMTYDGECKYCEVWEAEGEMYLDGDFYCAFGKKKEDDYEEPEINPCRGCEDYDGKGGCLSHGGCAEGREDVRSNDR